MHTGKLQPMIKLCAVAAVLLVVATAPLANGQNFNCPQLVLSERHNCVVGTCQGQYALYICNTSEYTSSFQCVSGLIPTCCGQQQVAYRTAAEQGDCPACPGSRIQPLLREEPLFNASTGMAKSSPKLTCKAQEPSPGKPPVDQPKRNAQGQ